MGTVRRGTDVSDSSVSRYESLSARINAPLIVVPVGDAEVRYFTSVADADAYVGQDAIQEALDLAGAWSDLDGDAMLEALDRIRHESNPTPPIVSID